MDITHANNYWRALQMDTGQQTLSTTCDRINGKLGGRGGGGRGGKVEREFVKEWEMVEKV